MRLWGVEDRQKPKLLSTVGLSSDIVSGECWNDQVPAEHVCCCVLFHPQAACTGLVLRPGLQVWYEQRICTLVSSNSSNRFGTWWGECSWGIFTHITPCGWWLCRVTSWPPAPALWQGRSTQSSSTPLQNCPGWFLERVKTSWLNPIREATAGREVWERKLVCNTEEEADPHIALTKTCLYAVARWTGHYIMSWPFSLLLFR